MSNLKERLADMSALSQSRTPADALKYIMKLEAKNKRLKALAADVIYSTGDDPEIMAASRAEWAARAFAAEAKLLKYDVLVKELFRLLERTEESDEGREIRPIKIICTRALDAEKLEQVLEDLTNVLEDRG